jgi:hypothetical protein
MRIAVSEEGMNAKKICVARASGDFLQAFRILRSNRDLLNQKRDA